MSRSSSSSFVVQFCVGIVCLVFQSCSAKTYKLYDPSKIGDEETAELLVPPDIQLLEIDGKAAPLVAKILGDGESRFRISRGAHSLKLQYRDNWTVRGQDFKVVQSPSITQDLSVVSGALYEITHRDIKNIKDAEKFASNVELEVQVSNENSLQMSPHKLSPEQDSELPQQSNRKISLVTPLKSEQGIENEIKLSKLELLKYWWSHSSHLEQSQFRKWINGS